MSMVGVVCTVTVCPEKMSSPQSNIEWLVVQWKCPWQWNKVAIGWGIARNDYLQACEDNMNFQAVFV